jgi:hypothetical protein
MTQADGYDADDQAMFVQIGNPKPVESITTVSSNVTKEGEYFIVKPAEFEQITPEALKGGFKADEGKSRVGLIPPRVILELGDLYAIGAKKYSSRNWELGMDFDRPYDALQRHLLKWWDGEELDPIDGQKHLTSVIWNAVALLHYMQNYEKYQQFDTRPHIVAPTRATEGNQK